MKQHPEINTVVDRIHRDVIGGAADISKEVVTVLCRLVNDSPATGSDQLYAEMQAAVIAILEVMPSFAPPINAMNRLLVPLEEGMSTGKSLLSIKEAIHETAVTFFEWSENALNRVAQYGAEKVRDGDVVFMYSMSSTVWRILRLAHAQGKNFRVIVTESRPGNEGLWTVDEMLKIGVPVSASIDACIGELVPEADVVFVGADAVSSLGTMFCKAGTYPTALVAKRHSIPFYVTADTSKFDATSLMGMPFRSDPVPYHEVLGDRKDPKIQVVGTLFDETPPDLVTGIITELGVFPPTACAMLIQQMSLTRTMSELLPSWVYGKVQAPHA